MCVVTVDPVADATQQCEVAKALLICGSAIHPQDRDKSRRLNLQCLGPLRKASRMDLQLISFDEPSETRAFDKGRFEVYQVGATTLGRATYEPGWRWREHVGAATGEEWCEVEHVGLVISGRAAVAMRDGTERLMEPGQFFYVPPGHDSWVVGEEPYVSLHIVGSEQYAK
jgi:hypothetical protein